MPSGLKNAVFEKESEDDYHPDTIIKTVSGQTRLKPGSPLYHEDGSVKGVVN